MQISTRVGVVQVMGRPLSLLAVGNYSVMTGVCNRPPGFLLGRFVAGPVRGLPRNLSSRRGRGRVFCPPGEAVDDRHGLSVHKGLPALLASETSCVKCPS